jgi:hypothetical protein
MLHEDQEVAGFGNERELEIRYPLPRLHQISRRFTAECDLRAPAQPLVVISQKHAAFDTDMAPIRCPKILCLKQMQPFLSQKLQINLNIDKPGSLTVEAFHRAISDLRQRFEWVKAMVNICCLKVNTDVVHIRLMFNSASTVRNAMGYMLIIWDISGPAIPGRVEVLLNNSNEQGEHRRNDFESPTSLGVWASNDKSSWRLDSEAMRGYERP